MTIGRVSGLCFVGEYRVTFDGPTATGVSISRCGRTETLRARREVILAGGVINSAQLLHLSGIGNPAHLAEIGVPLRHALPGVGQNLRGHYTPRFTARVTGAPTFNERTRGLAFGAEVAKWLAGRPSVLSLPSTVCYAFAKSDPVLDDSDLQVTFMPASYKEGVQSQLADRPGMTLAAWQQRPESTGTVLARSPDPFEAPLIQPNYLSAPGDRRVLLAGMKLARALMRTAPMRPYFGGELYPGEQVHTDDELLDFAKRNGNTGYHLVGTCRMGTDEMAVTHPDGRVHGIEGLRVVDASLMPRLISGNTNAPTIMMAEKIAAEMR